MEDRKVYVNIVTYKGRQWYDKCFKSLRESTIPVQTVVVDNTIGDEDADYIKTHYPEIHVIKAKENLGFGKANNLGLRYAYDQGCNYVFLLNQDTWLIKTDTIECLAQIVEHHPEYGIISPMHVMADEKTLNMDYEFTPGVCSERLEYDKKFGTLQDIYSTDYVNAAAWLLPRKTLEIVGGFDPLFTQYGEDDDYINRVRYHKLKIGICPALSIVHDHTPNNWSEEGQRLFRKANEDDLDVFLNINQEYNYFQLRWLYIKRLIKAWLRKDKADVRLLKHKLKYMRHNNKIICEHRNINQEKGLTWL